MMVGIVGSASSPQSPRRRNGAFDDERRGSERGAIPAPRRLELDAADRQRQAFGAPTLDRRLASGRKSGE